jgi:uncharacterized phage protein (TIGR01671 family)
MREIKFRAWDGASWIYSECVSKDNDVWRILDHEDDEWWACLEPQQYTGLKDKNGKEIYEGDIVDIKGDIFKDRRITLDDIREVGRLCDMFEDATFEVVGNIYENPELLEESE